MSISTGLAAAIAVSGNLVLSLRDGLAKAPRRLDRAARQSDRRRQVIVPDRRRPGRFYRDLAVLVHRLHARQQRAAFQFFALTGLSTNVVGAAAGTSVAFTALLAKVMLKERLGGKRLGWTIALFGAIAAAGFLGEGGSSAAKGLSPAALYSFLGLPLALGAALFIARRRFKGPRLAAVIAAVSGCLGGSMVFPLRALQVAARPDIAGWLSSPYLYAVLAAGSTSLILIQTAYKDGEMASVAPAFYGMQVLWPAMTSYFIFGATFFPVQTAAFAVVAVCVAVIAGFHPTAKKPVALLRDDRDSR